MKFKDYTTKEKWQVIIEYFLSILLPIIIILGYIYYVNNQNNYKNMIDYKTEVENLTINDISKGESLDATVKVINKNPDVPFFIRFKFIIDKKLLDGSEAYTLLKPINNQERLIIREGAYYYLAYKKTKNNLLFDEIEWLENRITAKGMDFEVKVEAIPATKNAVVKKWIKRGDLSEENAVKLRYVR